MGFKYKYFNFFFLKLGRWNIGKCGGPSETCHLRVAHHRLRTLSHSQRTLYLYKDIEQTYKML
jgi:hypothetical protein